MCLQHATVPAKIFASFLEMSSIPSITELLPHSPRVLRNKIFIYTYFSRTYQKCALHLNGAELKQDKEMYV